MLTGTQQAHAASQFAQTTQQHLLLVSSKALLQPAAANQYKFPHAPPRQNEKTNFHRKSCRGNSSKGKIPLILVQTIEKESRDKNTRIK